MITNALPFFLWFTVYILALRSTVSALSCVTACWFCCSILTATVINEYYNILYYLLYMRKNVCENGYSDGVDDNVARFQIVAHGRQVRLLVKVRRLIVGDHVDNHLRFSAELLHRFVIGRRDLHLQHFTSSNASYGRSSNCEFDSIIRKKIGRLNK